MQKEFSELIEIWNNRAASFRTYAGEFDLAKHKEGLSKEEKKHFEYAEKHMDACCRMIEKCAKEAKELYEQN